MSWVRYDDKFHAHPKVIEVKARCREALALHILCNTWSASTGSPGVVPLAAVVDQAGSRAKGLRWAHALVEAGLWHTAGHDCEKDCAQPPDDGYSVHDFDFYNPPNEELKRKRSEAGRKGAKSRWHGKAKPPDDDGNGMASAIDLPSDSHGKGVATDGIARGRPVPQPLTPTTTTDQPRSDVGVRYVPREDHPPGVDDDSGPAEESSEAVELARHYAAQMPLIEDHSQTLVTIQTALGGGYEPAMVRAGLDHLVTEQRHCTPGQLLVAMQKARGNWHPANGQPQPVSKAEGWLTLDVPAGLAAMADRLNPPTGTPELRALPGGAA